MESQSSHSLFSKTEPWIALALCTAVLASGALEQFVRNRPAYAASFAPEWLPLVATVFAAAAIMVNGRTGFSRLRQALLWTGLLLMVWAANGLPLDLLRVVGLIPLEVDWPGLATRTLALSVAIVLARHALRHSTSLLSHFPAWYGYAAFVLALPYPVLRTYWVLGGTVGLEWQGAAGQGFTPWLACVPWLLAAGLSLLLVRTQGWIPRRLLLAAGWSATTIVGMVGPAACWSAVVTFLSSGDLSLNGIAAWVPCLFYGSWFLWAVAAGAATLSYQLRSATCRYPRRDELHRA